MDIRAVHLDNDIARLHLEVVTNKKIRGHSGP